MTVPDSINQRISYIILFLVLATLFHARSSRSQPQPDGVTSSPKAHRSYPRPIGPQSQSSIYTVDHRVVGATLYPKSVLVFRSAEAKLKKGTTWLHFEGVPPNIEPGSVRIRVQPSHYRLSSVRMEKTLQTVIPSRENKAKLENLKSLYASLTKLKELIRMNRLQVDFINALSFKIPSSKKFVSKGEGLTHPRPLRLEAVLDSIRQNRIESYAVERELQSKFTDVEEQIKFETSSLDKKHISEQKWVGHLYVAIDSGRTGMANVEVEYRVGQGSWVPAYDVRAKLNPKEGSLGVEIIVGGWVTQETGKDWNQVKLTLSTASPVPLYLPKLLEWTLKENRVEVSKNDETSIGQLASNQRNRVDLGGKTSPSDSMDEVDEDIDSGPNGNEALRATRSKQRSMDKNAHFPLRTLASLYPDIHQLEKMQNTRVSKSRQVNLFSQQTVGEKRLYSGHNGFEIESPFSYDVPHSQRTKVAIQRQNAEGKLSYLAIPKKDPKVYLHARVVPEDSLALLNGEANVILNGDLIGKTQLDFGQQDGAFSINLGVDENVVVKRIVKKTAKTTGIFKSERLNEIKIQTEIANYHPYPIQIDLRDNFPLAPNSDISVKLAHMKPKGEVSRTNLIQWVIRVPSQAKKKVAFSYTVQHPKKYILSEME